jgi:hypothetical protein
MDDESYLEIDELDRKVWKNKKGEYHRLDGPAIETCIGNKFWYQNGYLHRLYGPAIELADGRKGWCKNGRTFKNKDTFFKALTEKEKEAALFSEDFLNA